MLLCFIVPVFPVFAKNIILPRAYEFFFAILNFSGMNSDEIWKIANFIGWEKGIDFQRKWE